MDRWVTRRVEARSVGDREGVQGTIPPIATDRRSFIAGSAIGGVIAFVVFTLILTTTGGHPDLLRHDVFGNFFDAQAQSLLHGHWDVPARELSFEGIRLGDRTYTYFGIWPSLLRMPILAVAPSLHGRLTQVSMLGAFVIFIVALAVLHWQIRQLVRPGRPCGRIEPAVVIVAVSCGSTVLFMASRAIVYNEAILWGIALSLLAYGRIIALIQGPSPRGLSVACLCSVLALLARASVGLGPVVALGLVAAGQLVASASRGRTPHLVARLDWLGAREGATTRPMRWAGSCIVCALLPAVAYVIVNYARFRSPLAIPWTKYVDYSIDRNFRRALANNGNSFFGAKFAPTNLLQYLRPDALSFDSLLPWVNFPRFRASVLGGVVLSGRTMATSITASMPTLVLLGVVGAAVSVRPRFTHRRAATTLRAPMLGSAVAVTPVLAAAYVGNRYLGDFVPLLVLAGVAGLQTLLRWRDGSGSRKIANTFVALAAVLATFSIWVNVSLALVYQRLVDPLTLEQRTEMVAFQYNVDRGFGGRPRDVVFVPALARRAAPAFTTEVVGSCEALYWSDGEQWWELEGRPDAGVFRLRVEFPPHIGRQWQPLLVTGSRGELAVGVRGSGHEVEYGLGEIGTDGALHWVPGLTARPRRTADVEIIVSRPRRQVSVLIAGSDVLDLPVPRNSVAHYRLGSANTPGVARTFAGRVTLRPPDLSLCGDLLQRERTG